MDCITHFKMLSGYLPKTKTILAIVIAIVSYYFYSLMGQYMINRNDFEALRNSFENTNVIWEKQLQKLVNENEDLKMRLNFWEKLVRNNQDLRDSVLLLDPKVKQLEKEIEKHHHLISKHTDILYAGQSTTSVLETKVETLKETLARECFQLMEHLKQLDQRMRYAEHQSHESGPLHTLIKGIDNFLSGLAGGKTKTHYLN